MSGVVCTHMKRNVGSTDRAVRIALGALTGGVSLAILAGFVALPMVSSLVLGVVALVLLGTAATGLCGLYSLLGVDTCPRSARGSR